MNNVLAKEQLKCIFFDLDHTLWDYETNSRETLQELFIGHSLPEKGVTDFERFHQEFKKVNAALWELYDTGRIGSEVIREERFKQILNAFQAYDKTLCDALSVEYLYECPKKGNLMPHAIEILQYLAANYKLSIITNGFEEIQNTKLTAGNLHQYFDHIITSQKAGHKKPAPEIFDYSLNKNGIRRHEAVMIGDNLLTDIKGARDASISHVFYNPEKVSHQEDVTLEIESLKELYGFL
ncbi:MAG TPA: YjjG family noncanonical pyrimidine nucleotidase [Cyclobacteriaceae bacterium]|nr:YjjG family noncanonical pyrimidine nucleotidase [Cyclobacteriaceae bacterium]